MSEFIQNNEKRISDLLSFTMGMIKGDKGGLLIEKYRESISRVSPRLVIALVDQIMQQGFQPEEIKTGINKVLNVFYKKLDTYRIGFPEEKHLLYYLMAENNEMDLLLKNTKELIKNINKKDILSDAFTSLKNLLLDRIQTFEDFELHYVKKENILFPFLEKTWPDYRCVNLMWSYHDDIRRSRKKLTELLSTENMKLEEFNEEIGRYYFLVYSIIFREEAIIFPVAVEEIDKKEWHEMLKQSLDIGFAFINNPSEQDMFSDVNNSMNITNNKLPYSEDTLIDLGTGSMYTEQLIMLLNNLPVDVTLVDEYNKVQYFSSPHHRIFPRSKAVIGRDVKNCHPPESVHIVEKLIEVLKTGRKNMERFWIEINERFIVIDYYALRDKDGIFKGVLEVSQDITEIRTLKGEKRLLSFTDTL